MAAALGPHSPVYTAAVCTCWSLPCGSLQSHRIAVVRQQLSAIHLPAEEHVAAAGA